MEPSNIERRFEIHLKDGQGVQIGDHGCQTNIFQLLACADPPLASQIRNREFQTLIEERTRVFVGRDFVFKAISNILADQAFPSGYIVVRGEPGIGKTALASEFVRRHNCVHHFNIASQNIRTSRDFLSNVCAQLIVRYGLPYSELPVKSLEDSGFLSRLLADCVAKDSSKVVIVVDALDEADSIGLDPSINRLCLPAALPPGVFFVVTCRDQHDDHLQVDREKTIYLDETDPDNQRDVSAYITTFVYAHRRVMQSRLQEWALDEDQFVAILTGKSEGNFMYLVYVLADIHEGVLSKVTIDNIRNLPSGLKSYYRRHWRLMKTHNPDEFAAHFEPVLCQLAVVKEPVSIKQLRDWTQLPENRITKVLNTWKQFLNLDAGTQAEPFYRFYHSSFREFLSEEVGLMPYHERIVDAALGKIPAIRAKGVDSLSS